MHRTRALLSALVAAGVLSGTVLVGCDKGPAQRTGEKIDNAIDKLAGKGPAEKAGERLDKAAEELKK